MVNSGNHLEEGYNEEDAQTVHGGVQGSSGCPTGWARRDAQQRRPGARRGGDAGEDL